MNGNPALGAPVPGLSLPHKPAALSPAGGAGKSGYTSRRFPPLTHPPQPQRVLLSSQIKKQFPLADLLSSPAPWRLLPSALRLKDHFNKKRNKREKNPTSLSSDPWGMKHLSLQPFQHPPSNQCTYAGLSDLNTHSGLPRWF